MVTPSPARPVLSLALLILVLATGARAEEPRLTNGLAIVTRDAPLARSITAGPTTLVELDVVLTDMDLPGVAGVQFGLEIDPRLTVLQTLFAPEVVVQLEVEPGEWVLGFEDCVTPQQAPYTIAKLSVLTSSDPGALDDLVVRLRELTTHGEPMFVSTCEDASLLDAVDMGGVVINPTGVSIPFFGSSATTVVEGRSYDLGWTTIDANAVSMDGSPVGAAGTQSFLATTSTSHVLVADGDAGSPSRTVDVQVIQQPVVEFFTAEIASEFDPPRTRLAWNVLGAETVTLQGFGSQPARGGLLAALDDVFTLITSNEFGSTIASVSPTGNTDAPPIVLSFGASPTLFEEGEPVTLAWSVYDADAVSITPEPGSVDPGSGSVQVFPTGETTYRLTASNAFGTTESSITVSPSPPRIDEFSVTPDSILLGGYVEIRWATRYAETVVLQPGDIDLASSGTLTLSPGASTNYQLIVSSAYGSTYGNQYVDVVNPVIRTFSVEPSQIFPGATVSASWRTTPGLELRIEPDVGPVDGATGTLDIAAPPDGTVFTLIGSVAGNDVVQSVADPIQWLPPEVVIELGLPTGVLPNETFAVGLECLGCDSLSVDPYPGPIDLGQPDLDFATTVDGPTAFTARGVNAKGATEESLLVEPIPIAPVVSLDVETVDPDGVLFPGGQVRVEVSVRYAATATLEPGLGTLANGQHVLLVEVDEPVQFEVVAENFFGRTTATQDAVPQPPVVDLRGTESIVSGEQASLDLVVAGADSIFLDPIFGQVSSGGQFTTPLTETTTFVARAVNAVGQTTDEWTVTVLPAEILAFRATPETILAGESSMLSWEVLGADTIELLEGDVVIAGGLGATGDYDVTPTETTTYRLRASSTTATVEQAVTVTLSPLVIDSFVADPPVVAAGGSTTLSWVARGQGEMEFVGFGTVPFEGSMTMEDLQEETTFELIGRFGGAEVDRASVTVPVASEGASVVRWSTSPDGSDIPVSIQPLVPFELYVVVDDPLGGLQGFELSAIVPPDWFLLRAVALGDRALAIQDHPDWVVGTGECFFVEDVVPILQYSFLVFHEGSPRTLDITGIPENSSLPSGVPAYANCANEILPLAIGDPLVVGGDDDGPPLAANPVELHATSSGATVSLEWSAPGVQCADRVHVMRTVGNDAIERVAELLALDACGSWVDLTAPTRLDEVRYRVILETGDGSLSSPDVRVQSAPAGDRITGRSRLLANAPNPFNPATELRFSLVQAGQVTLTIFDAAGRRVRQLDLGEQPAGEGALTWRGLDDTGRTVSSGAYLVRMITDDGVDTRRILLLK